MFLEIAFIQRFMLFLAYPVYAVAVVLTAFLVFSGLGSLCADRWVAEPSLGSSRAEDGSGRPVDPSRMLVVVGGAVVAIAAGSLLYRYLLPATFDAGAGLADAYKIVVSLMLLAPIAFAMGMPFPVGLQLVSDRHERLVPWAWAVNGAASVVGATLAVLAAVHVGFSGVVVLALGAYGVCYLALRGLGRA